MFSTHYQKWVKYYLGICREERQRLFEKNFGNQLDLYPRFSLERKAQTLACSSAEYIYMLNSRNTVFYEAFCKVLIVFKVALLYEVFRNH